MENELGDLRPFGDVLKGYRKQKRLTQRQLAARLGVHYNTIYRWEQGEFLPETRGVVLEVAKQLDLEQEQTRRLLEASLLSHSFYWTIPVQRNPFFTGREAILARLHTLLQQQSSVSLTQSYSLSGLGGIGKTQIAVEYAYQYSQEYSALFWLDGETQESLLASLQAIATALHLPLYSDQHLLVTTVKQWLTLHRDWLLIVDNLEQPALVSPFLPTGGQGRILYTTRLPSLGELAYTLEVEPMTEEDSVQFLLQHARPLEEAVQTPPSYEDQQGAMSLAMELGGLPLALDQARAYIHHSKCRLYDFLRLFQHAPLQLLQQREAYAAHPLSVTRTFLLAFEKVQQEHAGTAELLMCCCLLAPEEIPEALLTRHASLLSPALRDIVSDPFHFNQALKCLLSYALIQRRPQRKTIVVHRLVQAVLKSHLSTAWQQNWSILLVRLLAQAFPEDQKPMEVWSWCDQLLPHVLHCLNQVEDGTAFASELCTLLIRAADYLTYRTQFAIAEPLYQRAINLIEQTQGSEHPDLAPILTGLAQLYRQQSKYEEAECCFRRALCLLEESSQRDPLVLASTLLGLATLFWDLRRFQEARPLFERGIRIREEIEGMTHANLAIPLNNFGNLFFSQGNYAEAKALYRRALAIIEQARGPEHPDAALPLTNLGMMCVAQEQYDEAEPLLLRAIQIREQHLGTRHLSLAFTFNTLSLVYLQRDQYAQAEAVLRHALAIQEEANGSLHLHLYLPLNNLGMVCFKQGKYEEAKAHYLRALDILDQISGLTGYEKMDSLKGLADVFVAQECYLEAEKHYHHALRIMRQGTDTDPFELAEVHRALAALYVKQERHQTAETHYCSAIQIWEKYPHLHNAQREQCFKEYNALACLQQQSREGTRSDIPDERK